MLLSLSTALVLINGLGIMALTAMAFGHVERTVSSPLVRAALEGSVFGLGASIAMLSPAHVADGVFVDARGIFIGLAGAFGGPVAALIAVLIAGAARLLIGGVGALSGLCGIFLAALAELMWRKIYWRAEQHDRTSLFALGLMIPTSLISYLLLPNGMGVEILLDTAPILVLASVFAAVTLGTFIEREMALLRKEQRLHSEATTDPLTELMNRRSFENFVEDSIAGDGSSSALLIIDIDHFKAVNDKHGHDVGDKVLCHVASLLTGCVRQRDAVARIGGEEFAVFLPGISVQQAREVAARIRQAVENSRHGPAPVTVSIGLNWLPNPRSLPAIMAAADTALYAAKNSGRNRVIFASMAPPEPA